VILERAGDVLQNQSVSYRATVKRLKKAGYEGVLKHVDTSSCGPPRGVAFLLPCIIKRPSELTRIRSLI
jgi:hypothetical protein